VKNLEFVFSYQIGFGFCILKNEFHKADFFG